MTEYPKINSVWKRAQEKPCPIIVGQYARPEFEYLAQNRWVATEKVDGTNVRVIWDGGDTIRFGGKTDNAQMPTPLLNVLRDLFDDADRFRKQFPPEHDVAACRVCLYGEGYGGSIQRAGATYGPAQRFVLFDVKVGDWWLERPNVEDVSMGLGCEVVPVIATGTLPDLCEIAREGLLSTWGNFKAEGLVMKPAVGLWNRNGARVVAKIKTRDYENVTEIARG